MVDVAVAAADRFVEVLATLDRVARRQGRTLPTPQEKRTLRGAFWNELIPILTCVEGRVEGSQRQQVRSDVQAVLNPWFLRSRLWARAWLKPHGYAGDFRMLEWMYDLERDDCAESTQPAAANLLDDLYKSVHSVQAVWHRRKWFAGLITERLREGGAPVSVLDVACGGSRYVRDVVTAHGAEAVVGTFVDQDPAACSFVRSWLSDAPPAGSKIICAPVHRLPEFVPTPADRTRRAYDVAISTGLFDYLATERARELLSHMVAVTGPGGTVAICNFSPLDRSRLVKDIVADWQLIYRTRSELEDLFPRDLKPTVLESPDGGLLYAHATVV
jgi:SAM-dependent methyltransferase